METIAASIDNRQRDAYGILAPGMPVVEAEFAAFIEMLNGRDLDGLACLLHPEFEFHALLTAVEGRVYRGADGIREFFDDVDAAWQSPRFELEEVRRAGERAVAIIRYTGCGKAGRVPVEGRLGHVWTWRDGKPWRGIDYNDPVDALIAVGLRP